MVWLHVILLFISSICCSVAERVCARTVEPRNVSEENAQNFSSGSMVCKPGVDACFAFWKVIRDNNNASIIRVTGQGCWESSRPSDCPRDECKPQETKGNIFCCCTDDFCNANVSIVQKENVTTTTKLEFHYEKSIFFWYLSNGVYILLTVLSIMSVIVAVFVGWLDYKQFTILRKIKRKTGNQGRPAFNEKQLGLYCLSNVSLARILGEGRYGTVWLGSVKVEQVAVKIFPSHYSHYYYNEKDIYSLPFMNHPSILNYFGYDESNDGGIVKRCLFFSYCSMGTLQDYLKGKTLPLSTFYSMAITAVAGIAHLHTEVKSKEKWKPCITHRDINTRNILVKEDLTCCICDMGLAVKITGPHYYNLEEEMHAETKSISDVGTLRYMAPEVLEGAVNLRDCETSLKQIDVYALGLVLWEMAVRVPSFYIRSNDVQPYSLPFEKEVGLHPPLEVMRKAVCRNKARILFPLAWKNFGQAKYLKETVEDCTDQDGEARLTALCVQERLIQYCKASEDGSSSPACNLANYQFSAMIHNTNNNITNKFDHYSDSENTGDRDKTDWGVSEGTVETIVTHSPSESSSQLTFVTECLQPYQGRNPCLERNLHCDSSEEICIIETSAKDCKETQALISPTPVHRITRPHPVHYHQNSPFQPAKQTNELAGNNSMNKVVSRFSVPLMKLFGGGEGKLTVSPFESPRPTSLTLYTEEEEARLRELSGRIGTPGDLPPAVRKKRGERAARLSLYDDRIMSNCSF